MDHELEGGRANKIFKRDDVVVRPFGPWSSAVHKLLAHLHQSGFKAAPQPLGFDNQGNELVSFVEGVVHNGLSDPEARSAEALQSAAKLLRRYHDTTVYFLTLETIALSWMLPAQEPFEVLCHGDYAPYNVTQQGGEVVGIIDFDTAHPAPRLWDVAYAVYRWAPLSGPQNDESFGTLQDKIGRAKLFCDAYQLGSTDRKNLPEMTTKRLQALVDHMHKQANAGDETFASHIRDGHDQLYLGDIAFVKAHAKQIREGIA